ncbi:MAG: sigma-70 family RNA polymerase sigma factor [Pirellulaceae bacterium]|nr:sigma-70 family RNA polymerase sigma factor [Pirellulaceae bacterium]
MPSEENHPNIEDESARILRELQYERRERRAQDGSEMNSKTPMNSKEAKLMAELAQLLQQPLEEHLRVKHPCWEDILEDTLLRICEKFEQYDPTRRAMPWIYTIANNLLKDRFRDDARHEGRLRRRGKREGPSAEGDPEGTDEAGRQRQAVRVDRDERREQPEDREARQMTPEPSLEVREQLDKINKLIEQLPESDRQIFWLAIEKKSHKEIAKQLGKTVPAVTSSLFRSREKVIDGMGEDMREKVDQSRQSRHK